MDAPSRLGPWRIVEPLGSGGMGVVWVAEHETRGNRVAIKTVRVPQERQLGGIRREVSAIARLRHPGIVRVVDHGVEDGIPWYAMELLEDVSLRKWAAARGLWATEQGDVDPRRTPETLREALVLVRQICVPLAFLHGAGLVHRDLKPGNVLVRADGMPVLLDFGVTTRFAGSSGREALEAGSALVGTVSYMSPEQILGDNVDARVDLYALGCMLFELVTGEKPFAGTQSSVLYKHVHEPAPSPSDLVPRLPAGLDALVGRLLAKEPRDRIGYASDVALAIEKIVGEAIPPMEAPRPRPYLYRPTLAGRKGAMKAATQRIDDAKLGGAMLLVGGDSGIGKTRLLLEIGAEAVRSELRVIPVPCGAESGPLQALRPLLQALADRCHARPMDIGRLLGEHGPVLALYEPALAPFVKGDVPDLPPDAARLRLARALESTVAGLAGERGVVVLIDDLHLADPLSLEVLAEIGRGKRIRLLPLVIIGTFRSRASGDLGRLHDAAPRITIDRLDEAAVGDMVADMLALPEPPPLFVGFLARHSEGNPLFVAEYLRAAVDEGLLWRDADGDWQVLEHGDDRADPTDYARMPVPRSLKALLKQRLGPLSPAAAAVVAAVATVGREAPLALLAPMTRLEEAAVAEAVAELVRAGVLEDRSEGLRFAHGQMQALVYDPLKPEQKQRLHRRAARELEARFPDRIEALSAELATHWERAGDTDRARERWYGAARRAAKMSAYADAERAFRAGLALSEPGVDTVLARTELAQRVLDIMGRDTEALAEQQLAAEEARASGSAELQARAELGLGRLHQIHGRRREAAAHQEKALALARAADEPLLVGRALNNLALLAHDEGRDADAQRWFEEDLAIVRAAGDRDGEAATLGNLSLVLRDLGRLDEAAALDEQALALLRALGDRFGEGLTLGNKAELASDRGLPFDEIRALHLEALAVQRETGNKPSELLSLVALAQVERRIGRYAEADRWLDAAEVLLPEVRHPHAALHVTCGRGLLALACGRDARRALQEASEALAAAGSPAQSPGGRAVAKLRRAIEAKERIHGEAASDLPRRA